jgi:hypothetical protein
MSPTADQLWQSTQGSGPVAQEITGAGQIASEEACGAPEVIAVIIGAGHIASAEAFGQPALSPVISASEISTSEALGAPALAAVIDAAGIASAESFGQPNVYTGQAAQEITGAGGLASEEAVGSLLVEAVEMPVVPVIGGAGVGGKPPKMIFRSHAITGAGAIPSEEAFGLPLISTGIEPAGIVPSEAFGQAFIEEDFTDDDIVMALMMAAWEQDEIEVS